MPRAPRLAGSRQPRALGEWRGAALELHPHGTVQPRLSCAVWRNAVDDAGHASARRESHRTRSVMVRRRGTRTTHRAARRRRTLEEHALVVGRKLAQVAEAAVERNFGNTAVG